ncbi:hypothetical protein FOA43_004065 [Brettanomyces nanus]|uniref:RRM domain-containing protein n=1 Tax=Eeniella nana TaxID=13502 RepID=A0A875S4V9_EENNA|nr:uncharacterized protein FOA43_004065 [Brettanomyces nanus]QPG76671.1 hypothetical protein FOA43_004065 [Brettanomyces nanus]
MPSRGRKNKGFAYVDFKTEAQQTAALSLSETDLNGRNLLIKKSDSYEGRPTRTFPESHNPPSRILFVGNLSFDTTEDQLKNQFMHCGEILRVRMATFEDSGKCKGFAFLDFKDEEGPVAALKDKSCHKMMTRPLRMEFGEDRSKRRVNRSGDQENGGSREIRETRETTTTPKETNHHTTYSAPRATYKTPSTSHDSRPFKRSRDNDYAPNKRLRSSIALAIAQRENPGVKAQGKKVKF